MKPMRQITRPFTILVALALLASFAAARSRASDPESKARLKFGWLNAPERFVKDKYAFTRRLFMFHVTHYSFEDLGFPYIKSLRPHYQLPARPYPSN